MAALTALGCMTEVENAAIDLARKLATVGTGKSTKLGGGCIIVGDAELLLSETVEPAFGEVTNTMCRVRHMHLNILDSKQKFELFKTVQTLATHDGSIVFDKNGDLHCGNYLVILSLSLSLCLCLCLCLSLSLYIHPLYYGLYLLNQFYFIFNELKNFY